LARRTLEPIEKMVEAQNRFTADASHELRTPLAAMQTEIEVGLRDKKLNLVSSKKLLRSNLEEVKKLEKLANTLLKLEKYHEHPNLEFQNLSLTEIITESFGKVEKKANTKLIEFKNKFEKVSIKGDKDSLIELFSILLDNAIKYSPIKSTISIKTHRVFSHAEIKIVDQGFGIKADDLPNIFNRFFRSDNSRSKEKDDGFGLGLSIAKRIVKLNKGSISVISKPKIGTTFSIKLPTK
jgi:signal transduction histidine kinase